MRALIVTILAIGIVSMAGCRKQRTDDLATVPPGPDFDAAPVYGSVDMDTDVDLAPQPVEDVLEPILLEQTPQPVTPVQPVAPSVHVVARGETLWRIAVRYYGDGQRWRDIAAANGNIDPKKLAVGQRLVLP